MVRNIIILLLAVCGGAGATIITYQYIYPEQTTTTATTSPASVQQVPQKIPTSVTVIAQVPVDREGSCKKSSCIKFKRHAGPNTKGSPDRF